MTDTTAGIAAKGCQSTGITEEIARRLHDRLGSKVMAVVELVAETRTETKDGKQRVGLSILSIEPAQDRETEAHLRRLQRSFHYERKLHSPDQPLDIENSDDLEPKVADVLAAGRDFENDDVDQDDDWGGESEEDPDDDDRDPADEHSSGPADMVDEPLEEPADPPQRTLAPAPSTDPFTPS